MSNPQQLIQQKRQLRQQLRQKRRALSLRQQQLAGRQLARVINLNFTFMKAQHIALYLANDGEIDPQYILKKAVKAGKHCYLPVLTADGKIGFSRYKPGDILTPNRFGIPEPKQRIWRPAKALDLVLMPLVGFDRHGGRLGMGGGFYDKTFEWIKTQPILSAPILLGLAHSCQEVDRLELESWDIPLSAVATDKGFLSIK